MHIEASEEITSHFKAQNTPQWSYRNSGEMRRKCNGCGKCTNYKPGLDCTELRHFEKYQNRKDAVIERKTSPETKAHREFLDANKDRIIKVMKGLSRDGRINSIYRVLMRDQYLREGIEKIGMNVKVLSRWLCRQSEVEIVRDERKYIRFRLKGER
ncbi:MAG: hypothetical protein M1344_04685 [Candidatus Thermoplasmatota archaeon]|nr:hypothetical protein [Candidatus Thermoplasmatota archaeon]